MRHLFVNLTLFVKHSDSHRFIACIHHDYLKINHYRDVVRSIVEGLGDSLAKAGIVEVLGVGAT